MPDDWVRVRLGDLVEIKHGYAFEGEYFRDDPPGHILFSMGNFKIGGGFQEGRVRYYIGPLPHGFTLEAGDLMVTMSDVSKNADALGYPALVPLLPNGARYVHNQRVGKVVLLSNDAVDKRFLYYLMTSKPYRDEVLASATGTAIKHTAPSRLLRFQFQLPPLLEQRSIAGILSALDDKVELNRRMNSALESMARALFQSWFVDFDPVRAKAAARQPEGMDAATAVLFPDAFEDSPLGSVPRGWRVGTFDSIATNTRRGVIPGEIPPETPYIGLEHIPSKSIALEDWGTAAEVSSNKFAFRKGEILFGKLRPYFHKVGVAPVDGVCSTDIVVIAPKTPDWFGPTLLLASSAELVEYATARSDGTRMPRTSWHDLAQYSVVVPSEGVAQAFTHQIQPLIHLIICNIAHSHTLASIRDALLPKLLSGEVRVG